MQKNEHGFTIVEMLAVIVLSSIFLVLATTTTVKAIQNYDTIKQESILRDEADIIMTTIYKNLYVMKESQFCTTIAQGTTVTSFEYSKEAACTSKKVIGYKNNQLLINNEAYTLNPDIQMKNFVIKKTGSTLYEISFELAMKNKKHTKVFKNEVRTIKN
jgi:prepilin-type N-terminal cleavage/methylation domain-containing protein